MARYDISSLKTNRAMFDKIFGAQKRQDGLTKIGRKKYEARFGYGVDSSGNGYNYVEQYRGEKPTLEYLKKQILAIVDANTDNAILQGYTYNGKKVWLSSENQFNYKAAYDLAVQTNGGNLPVKVKLGDTGDTTYVTFEKLEDFKAFYVGAMDHIQKCLQEGWTEKDSIDWKAYECED